MCISECILIILDVVYTKLWENSLDTGTSMEKVYLHVICIARAMVSTRARFNSSDSADRSFKKKITEHAVSKFNKFKGGNENIFLVEK